MPRVLVAGSANIDFTVALARLPQAGETVTNGTLLVNHGGKGANQAVAAQRLGADVRLIGCVGDDASGREVRAALDAAGVGTAGVMVSGQAATGTALILVDGHGRNQIAVAPGANRALAVDHVRSRAEDFAWAEVLIVSCEIPLACVRAALAEARRRGVPTILNPAPVPDTPVDFLDLADYVTPNEGEAGRLTGLAGTDEAALARAAQALRGRGAGVVLVTLGERGVLMVGAAPPLRVPAFAVKAIDTTAAGDAFAGALAVAVTERRPLVEAVRFANAAAALTCTRRGAQASLPVREEVARLSG